MADIGYWIDTYNEARCNGYYKLPPVEKLVYSLREICEWAMIHWNSNWDYSGFILVTSVDSKEAKIRMLKGRDDVTIEVKTDDFHLVQRINNECWHSDFFYRGSSRRYEKDDIHEMFNLSSRKPQREANKATFDKNYPLFEQAVIDLFSDMTVEILNTIPRLCDKIDKARIDIHAEGKRDTIYLDRFAVNENNIIKQLTILVNKYLHLNDFVCVVNDVQGTSYKMDIWKTNIDYTCNLAIVPNADYYASIGALRAELSNIRNVSGRDTSENVQSLATKLNLPDVSLDKIEEQINLLTW